MILWLTLPILCNELEEMMEIRRYDGQLWAVREHTQTQTFIL